MLLRAIRYCSTFEAYLHERESLRVALLLNKYPENLTSNQFNHVLLKFNIDQPLSANSYTALREKLIQFSIQDITPTDHRKTIFVHFAYSTSMRTFPVKFHTLWRKYFELSPINEIVPVLGTRNIDNLQRRLIYTRQLLIIENE
ncbi:unnamed protein product [Didymodactylos carnosus]|nr:unnamed protein product [Didymodactylos carnosus]CAF4490138.1 unnamed protein product [Didymodactylos carnosus]